MVIHRPSSKWSFTAWLWSWSTYVDDHGLFFFIFLINIHGQFNSSFFSRAFFYDKKRNFPLCDIFSFILGPAYFWSSCCNVNYISLIIFLKYSIMISSFRSSHEFTTIHWRFWMWDSERTALNCSRLSYIHIRKKKASISWAPWF